MTTQRPNQQATSLDGLTDYERKRLAYIIEEELRKIDDVERIEREKTRGRRSESRLRRTLRWIRGVL